jgi:hypothetical protein
VQCIAQRLDEFSLAQTRNAFENHVAARKNRHQDIVDDVAVTDDNLGDFSANPLEFSLKRLQVFLIQLSSHGPGLYEKF